MEDLFEYRKISLVVRAEDRRKIIQSFLALSLANFERAGKDYIVEISKNVLEGNNNTAKAGVEEYLKYVEEYHENIKLVSELIEAHLIEDDHRVKAVFPVGKPVPLEEMNEKLQKATKEKQARKKRNTRKKAVEKED